MEWTNASQLHGLLLSGGFGFLLGIYYELFRWMRRLFRSQKGAIFVQDILFCVTASIATFLFDLYLSGGQLRLYLFIGLAVGFAVYYGTLGRFVLAISDRLVSVLRTVFAAVMRPFSALACWGERIGARVWSFLAEKTRGLKRFFSKNLLKKRVKVLYNQEE